MPPHAPTAGASERGNHDSRVRVLAPPMQCTRPGPGGGRPEPMPRRRGRIGSAEAVFEGTATVLPDEVKLRGRHSQHGSRLRGETRPHPSRGVADSAPSHRHRQPPSDRLVRNGGVLGQLPSGKAQRVDVAGSRRARRAACPGRWAGEPPECCRAPRNPPPPANVPRAPTLAAKAPPHPSGVIARRLRGTPRSTVRVAPAFSGGCLRRSLRPRKCRARGCALRCLIQTTSPMCVARRGAGDPCPPSSPKSPLVSPWINRCRSSEPLRG